MASKHLCTMLDQCPQLDMLGDEWRFEIFTA